MSSPITAPLADSQLPAALAAERLTKVYGRRAVVNDVSFRAEHGEILGLLGLNGAGKTTIMRMLAGYTPSSSGRAWIAGYDVSREPMAARRKLGYLPETTPLYPEMSVGDYLKFFCEIKGCAPAQLASTVNQALEECSLTEVRRRVIGNLSRGYRQRVCLAQAILGDPSVLILDEPTVGLDPRQIAEIRNLIKEMAGRRTVLLSTHILPEVSMVCQKVIVIDGGRLIASGTPDRLTASDDPARAVSQTSIEVVVDAAGAQSTAIAALLGGVEGVERAEVQATAPHLALRVFPKSGADPRAAIARTVIAAGHGLLQLGFSAGSLEEVFLRVLSHGSPNDAAAASEEVA